MSEDAQQWVGVLRGRGHTVSAVATQPERESLLEDPHDLVIVSDRLACESGLEFVAELRNLRGPDELPVIVLTSGGEEAYMRAFAAGASDCLSRDVAAPLLLAKCAHLLARVEERTAPSVPVPVVGDLLFERYRVDGFLGEGAYGAVYAATDTTSGEEVALKVLSDGSPASKRRFLRETYTMASARGPNLVPIIHSGVERGIHYYAMGRVKGDSVEDHVRRQGPATEEEAIALLRGIANALVLLERTGLLHRDIKPSNIVLRGGSYASPVLVDFGLAKRPTDRGLTSPGVMLGTPGYMAPEYFVTSDIDFRSDLFAAGVVVLFACTGSDPFPALHGFQLLDYMSTHPLSLPDGLSAPFRALLRDLTRIDRDQRIASADDLLRRLDSLRRKGPRDPGAGACFVRSRGLATGTLAALAQP